MNGNLNPFARAVGQLPALADFIDECARYDVPPHEAVRNYDHMKTLEVWKNDEYQVAIDKNPPHGFDGFTIWHLSIKRLDRAPLHDWRDLQAIKNMLAGESVEAIELYPAQARVVDTSNQFHLYAFMRDGETTNPVFPIGWTAGMILEPDAADGSFAGSKAKQRPGGRR